VPVRDAPALAEALARLIADPDMRRRMGERGRALAVGEFSREQVITDPLTEFREVNVESTLNLARQAANNVMDAHYPKRHQSAKVVVQ